MYYLPMHGSQITGFVSAKIGLAASCTNAVQGHTDSLFTIGLCSDEMNEYQRLMTRAGYDAPTKGLGSFDLEVENAHGSLVNGNLYTIKYEERGEDLLLVSCRVQQRKLFRLETTTLRLRFSEHDNIREQTEKHYLSWRG
jgi:hypothetical protein